MHCLIHVHDLKMYQVLLKNDFYNHENVKKKSKTVSTFFVTVH